MPAAATIVAVFASLGLLAQELDRATAHRQESLPARFEALKKLATPLGAPGPSDWLAQHYESGRGFREYIAAGPVRRTKARQTIYLLPIGEFTPEQERVLQLTAAYMRLYFDTPVTVRKRLPLSRIPQSARRKHPNWGMEQILSTHVLDSLRKERPEDVLAYIALTATDLWPGRGWNFVFGQASIHERVGVWSLYRNGDPSSAEGFRICLRRTIKTAVHEAGHILSIRHCIAWDCIMNGSNHREEADSRPLQLCPSCLCKLCWNLKISPIPRHEKLAAFCQEQGLVDDAIAFRRAIQAMGGN